MSPWRVDERFHTKANADVLGFLRQVGPAAHSDVADELALAGAEVPESA